jgi:iron complex outermembrane receptor protein
MNYTINQQRSADLFRRALVVGLGAQLIIPVALGQDTATETPTEMTKTVVTGTRLTGAEVEGALSVSTYDLEKPLYQGYSNTAEMLRRKLPQFGGGIGTINQGFGNGGNGRSTISLRNLPEDRTLLLLNGRRMAVSDLSLIPEVMIEKVEVLNDGASSIYGSDAVAGVVNIITKKEFNGVELQSFYLNTTETDISERRFGAIWGETTEKGSFTLGAEYSKANSQLSIDRDVSSPTGDSVSATSNPGTFSARGLAANLIPLRWSLVPGRTLGLTNAAQIPAGFNPVAAIDRTGMTAVEANNARNAEEARLNALLPADSPVRYGASPSLLPGVNPGFPFGVYTVAVRPHERYSAFGSAEYELFGKNLEAFADLLYTRNQSLNILAPSPLGGRVVPTANYWYNQVFPTAAGSGTPLNFGYRPVELGPRITYWDFDLARLTAGLKGQIGETSWKWETAFTYERQEVDETQTGGVLADVYTDLLGQGAAGAFNPFGYTPIGSPVGGTAVNPAATIASLSGSAGQRDVFSSQQFDFNVGGEVFDLPGGAIQITAGYQNERISIDQVPDFALLQGLVFPFNADSPFHGTRDINSGFGELNIPLLGEDFNVPAIHSFSVQVAGRIEHFSDLSPHSTDLKPRVSFRWEVIEKQLTVHGSWAQGFVAPALRDLSLGSPFVSFDELLNPLTTTRTQPEEGVVYVGNDKLKPAESDSYLIGATYSPDFLKGFTIGANYYRIEETGIPFESSQYVVNQWFAAGGPDNPANPFGPTAGPSSANPLGAQVELKTDGELYQVRNVGPINSGDRTTDGIDLFTSYEMKTDVGTFTFSGQATRVLTFEQEDFPGAGSIDYLGRYWGDGAALGNYGFPEWKANAGISWEFDRYTAAVGWNYSSGYDEVDVARSVESYQTFDLRLGYKIHYVDVQLNFGINNLFDEAPPTVVSSFENQYDRALADIRQRMYYVSLSKKF